MQVVDRWIREGCNGAKLEVVRIDESTLTSQEAVQRWVVAQSQLDSATAGPPVAQGSARKPPEPTQRQAASERVLAEFRATRTELDKAIRSLPGFKTSTLAHAAGTLFRAGLRSLADVRRLGAERLLEVPRLGPASKLVVLALLKALEPADQAQCSSGCDR